MGERGLTALVTGPDLGIGQAGADVVVNDVHDATDAEKTPSGHAGRGYARAGDPGRHQPGGPAATARSTAHV
ncbi:MAG: hypothetical protein AB7O78_08825 [Thermoleophilia bacterium]